MGCDTLRRWAMGRVHSERKCDKARRCSRLVWSLGDRRRDMLCILRWDRHQQSRYTSRLSWRGLLPVAVPGRDHARDQSGEHTDQLDPGANDGPEGVAADGVGCAEEGAAIAADQVRYTSADQETKGDEQIGRAHV